VLEVASVKNMRRSRRAALCVGLSVAALVAGAAPETIDRIAAIVDDQIVLASELAESFHTVMARLEDQGRGDVPAELVWNQVMEDLIQERVQLQEASRRSIEVDDETLTAAVGDFADQNNMTVEQFTRELERVGESYAVFRERIRRQILIERVQRNVVNRRVYISDQDINDLLASPFFQEMVSDEYRLGHILLQLEPGATPEDVREVRAAAEALVEELRGGADFAALAVKHSAAASATRGGDLDWRKSGRIPSLFVDVAVALGIGEVADPIQAASGFHIVKLIDKRGASQERAEQTRVRHILLTPTAIRSDEQTRAAIEGLRARIIAGEDFAEVAKEFSEDPGSGLAGGDLDWTTGEEFDPLFLAAMNATAVGELSEPFRTDFGWHILEVQGRRQQDVSEDALRDAAFRILYQRRFEERLQEWLAEIRDEAFVEQRISFEEFATSGAWGGAGPGS